MDHVLSPAFASSDAAIAAMQPENPVIIARQHRISAAANWFIGNFPGHIFYAVKANPSLWALDALWAAGVRGFDVASEAEVALIGERFPGARMAFMHPVKSRRAIGRAYHDFGVRAFVLDDEAELAKILAETNHAKDLTLIVRLAVSNDGATMPLAQKFGIGPAEAPALLRAARGATEELMGVSFHVGSQCMRPISFKAAMLEANRAIVKASVVADVVDVGGGFPAIYPGLTPPPMAAYVREIAETFEQMFVAQNAELWAEPGRALVAEAGAIVARVELRKGDALYLNDGAYGNLFDATHVKWPYPVKALRQTDAPLAPFRFYGPTCDSLDAAPGPFLLPADLQEGDYIEIGMLGAYGAAMGTRFNGFGENELALVEDAPWPSLFGGKTEPAFAEEANVVQLAEAKKAKKRRK